jgi:hypothetical protein
MGMYYTPLICLLCLYPQVWDTSIRVFKIDIKCKQQEIHLMIIGRFTEFNKLFKMLQHWSRLRDWNLMGSTISSTIAFLKQIKKATSYLKILFKSEITKESIFSWLSLPKASSLPRTTKYWCVQLHSYVTLA